jgi:hypothetical protein
MTNVTTAAPDVISRDMIERFRIAKEAFLININIAQMEEITMISQAVNPFLYPQYLEDLDMISIFSDGVFLSDPKGIYTPIETARFGIFHLERIPITTQSVYAITEISKCAYIRVENKILIYKGVFKGKCGYMFISDDSYIKPITSISFSKPNRLVICAPGSSIPAPSNEGGIDGGGGGGEDAEEEYEN